MPRQLSPDLKQQVLDFLSSSQEGVSITEITTRFKGAASKRSLQRALAQLIEAKQAVTEGKARAIRYRLAPNIWVGEITEPPDRIQGDFESYVPLSPTGAEIRDKVRKPLTERIPVGFNREFLDRYLPNGTAYLTPEIRSHLHRLGITSDGTRPAGTYARQVLQRLLVDLSWASSRLEGNTYSLLETEKLLHFGEEAQGKDASETQMILNHKRAIEFLVESTEEIGLSPFTLRNLHALLSENLLLDPAACGRLRNSAVGIGGSVYSPLEVGQMIEECFVQILDTAGAIRDPFEQAFFLMVQLPYLQPFDDVNKRVSRLAANVPLFKQNLCPLSFIDVPEKAYIDGNLGVYELNRVELLRDVFVWAYERSSQRYLAVRQSLGEPDPFRMRYREEQLHAVRKIVQERLPGTTNTVREAAVQAGVPREHLDHFVRLVLVELRSLHEGNIARYRLRPSDFTAWGKLQEGERTA